MLNNLEQEDQQNRKLALDPSQSFIIQAPAGSGKTELLSQRYLKLLTAVNQPEEIIALSFTNKSAAEMRQRIILALEDAFHNRPIIEEHQKVTRALAEDVLKSKPSWNLLESGQRMQITTLDALCYKIIKSTPLLSQTGGNVEICTQPKELYQMAIQSMMQTKDDFALHRLISHLDNNNLMIEQLLTYLLEKREQWLPFIAIDSENKNLLREALNHNLNHYIESFVRKLNEKCQPGHLYRIKKIAENCSKALKKQKKHHALIDLCGQLDENNYMIDWKVITEMLLTPTHTWRKRLDSRMGFMKNDPSSEEDKHWLIEQISTWKNDAEILPSLVQLRLIHENSYNDRQWSIICDLIDVLPKLVAKLKLHFQSRSVVDFNEINSFALLALGTIDQPSEIAYHLNHAIKHILIDEFQDTSNIHFQLINEIVKHWDIQEHRTLFLVGDPQQSIYRFRQANVGLFLETKNRGIGPIHPTYLCLRKNFRSDKKLVDGFNTYFKSIFGDKENSDLGMIAYQPSISTKEIPSSLGIHHHPIEDASGLKTAIKQAIMKYPAHKIAILIRSRTHLSQITECLNDEKIPYYAHEIERLSENQSINDLILLTLAIKQPANRLLWLSCLRAPWCGLTLSDLYIIANAYDGSIFHALSNLNSLPLSQDGQIRAQHFASVMLPICTSIDSGDIKNQVKTAWQKLGENHLETTLSQSNNIQLFLETLSSMIYNSTPFTEENIRSNLNQSYADSGSNKDNAIQIMTIHKAKGLEFDHVILTHLEKSPRQDPSSLLRWDSITIDSQQHIIFTPIPSFTEEEDSLYDLIKYREKEKNLQENKRLLYVAMTRAKKNLHLIYQTPMTNESDKKVKLPAKNSFLSMLYHLHDDSMKYYPLIQALENPSQNATHNEKKNNFHRIRSSYFKPNPSEETQRHETQDISDLFIYQTRKEQQIIGEIIHTFLEDASLDGINHWNHQRVNELKPRWAAQLKNKGMRLNLIDKTILKCHEYAIKIINDPKAKWILNPQHRHAQSEFEVTYKKYGAIKHYCIDRLFIDNNCLWIIDYKCTMPDIDQDMSEFLNEQISLYKKQLNTYERVIKDMINMPTKKALYFPLIPYWHEL